MVQLSREAMSFASDRNPEDLDSDDMLGHALAQLLIQMGANAAKISPQGRADYPNVAWDRLAETGEKLIVEYYEPHAELVWRTVTEDLPPLRAALEKVV